MLSLFHTLLTIFSIALLFVAVGTLLWFLYSFFLKRIIRARRIANLRLNRMMDEMERRPRQQ
jgi:F0F1-type ATP synthase membrane subunit b/b'